MGEESEAVLKGEGGCRALPLKGQTLEACSGENSLQDMARSLVKISRGEKSPGFISPPCILNGYLYCKDCLQRFPFLSTRQTQLPCNPCTCNIWSEVCPAPKGMILSPLSPLDQAFPWCYCRVCHSVCHVCILGKLLCVLTAAEVCMVLLGIYKHSSSVHSNLSCSCVLWNKIL